MTHLVSVSKEELSGIDGEAITFFFHKEGERLMSNGDTVIFSFDKEEIPVVVNNISRGGLLKKGHICFSWKTKDY